MTLRPSSFASAGDCAAVAVPAFPAVFESTEGSRHDTDSRVHPALPWVEIKSATVEQDSFFEILNVSITTEKPDGPQLAAPTFLSISNLFSLEEPELKTLEMRDLLSLH